jgi:hypothetical protein
MRKEWELVPVRWIAMFYEQSNNFEGEKSWPINQKFALPPLV